MTTAIIVDDEIHLADYLADKLAALWPELNILAHAHNGADALKLADTLKPDIAFLDIHMPGLTGLQVAETLSSTTHIVFVTAFDEYAIAAIKREAKDYILKPIKTEELAIAIVSVMNDELNLLVCK